MSTTFQEAFDTSSSLTFNSTHTEMTSGSMRQKDKKPSGLLAWATYDTTKNFNYSDYDVTVTASSVNATITAGALDLGGGYLDIDTDIVNNMVQQGCIRIGIVPGYSGAPATDQNFFASALNNASNAHHLTFWHGSDGNIYVQVLDGPGSGVSTSLGAWSASSGVVVEHELNFNVTAGRTQYFINGTQHGLTQTATITRNSSNTVARIGSNRAGNETSNFDIAYVGFFSTPQHTSNYTVDNSSIPSNRYSGDTISRSSFEYTGPGDISQFSELSFTQTNGVRIVLNGRYHNGTGWTTSSDTYATATDASTAVANITSLPIANTLTIKLFTDDSNAQMTVSDLTVTYKVDSRCVINGDLIDLIGDMGTNRSAKFIVRSDELFTYDNYIVAPFERTFLFDANGYVKTTRAYLETDDSTAADGIIETGSIGKSPYTFEIQYSNSNGETKKVFFPNRSVPATTTAELVSLLS